MTPSSIAASGFITPSAPLVGRGREQRVLRERLNAVCGGQGSLVLIGGEAGIGKTSLVDWLAAEARQRGALVLSGQCYDLTQAPPYGPWREAFSADRNDDGDVNGQHPLQVGADLGAITSQELLFAQVRDDLARRAAKHPIVLVLEDLHWSDPSSLELLRFLARGLDALPVLLAATYRVDELTRHHPLFQLLPHLVREARAERIDLPRLTTDEVRGFVTDRYQLSHDDKARLVAYVASRAGGNPFYLDELLRTLEADDLLRPLGEHWNVGDLAHATVPPLVRQIIENRLLKLDPETLRLLEIAAVIGQEVSIDLWQSASDADAEQLARAVDEAIEAHLILEVPARGHVRFAHALMRETLYFRQALLRRRTFHRGVAELLAAAPDPPLSVVASHFANADDSRAVDWLVRAGDQALSLYAARDAIDAFSRAHDLATRFAIPLLPEAYRARAAGYALIGDFDSARHDRELVLERARAANDRLAEWQALVDLSVLWAERDYERTGRYGRAALELARAIGDEPTIAHSLNRIANWHVNLDESNLASPLHQEALAIFERHGDRVGIADTLDLLGMASYLSCDSAAGTAYCERAIALFRQLDDRPRLASCLTVLALTGGNMDVIAVPTYRETAFWIRSVEEGLEIARNIGWLSGEAFAHFTLSITTGVRGQFGRALEHARAAETFARRIDHHQWTIASHCSWASAWLVLLDSERAAAELEQGLAAARVSGSRFWINLMAGMRASALVSSGDRDQAAALLSSVLRGERSPRSMGQRRCWLAHAELFLAGNDPERALAIIDAVTDEAPDEAATPGQPLLRKLRGDAFVQLQRVEEAEQAYLAARNSAALYGFRPLLWQIDGARGQSLLAEGRTVEAEAALQSAHAVIEDLAGTIPDETIREQFRARARERLPIVERSRDREPDATSLSPRELEVLRLIVEGQSDREIADALSISPRTVMRHVASILTKLDVASRTAAATLAMRQQIV